MSDRPTYAEVLDDFAAHAGLDAAALAATQEIVVDGQAIGLQLDGDDTVGDVLLFCLLGTPDAAQFGRIARTLLEANNFWVGTAGCTLGAQRDTGTITLCGRAPLDGLTGEALAVLVDAFADTAAYWRAFVNGTPEQAGTLSPFDMAMRFA